MNKSYVIRASRFTAAQKKAYDSLSSRFLVPLSDTDIKINYKQIFGNSNGVTLEIGFGSGTATAAIAAENPDKNYLAVEVHRPGIGRLLWEIEKRELSNIRIIEYDAAQIVEKMIPEASLDAVHIFFPDPWPKKRHHKRRLIRREFTEKLVSCLKKSGYLYMVTDWEDYAVFALEELAATATLRNSYEGFAQKQEWRPQTKFEKKGLAANHVIRELFFVKE